jgi:hypothetical protein
VRKTNHIATLSFNEIHYVDSISLSVSSKQILFEELFQDSLVELRTGTSGKLFSAQQNCVGYCTMPHCSRKGVEERGRPFSSGEGETKAQGLSR